MANGDQAISSGINFPEDPTAGIPGAETNTSGALAPDPAEPTEIPPVIQRAHAVTRPDLVRMNPYTGEVDEICTVIAAGMIYEDWESVWIQWNWTDWFSRCRLTCAEREPYPLPGQVLQLAPGDQVEVLLGGIKVITGIIVTRQVAYDANQHGVMLEIYSASWFAQRSSIEHKTNDFSGKTFLQIADEILAPTGVGYKTIGKISQLPFDSGATPPTGATIGQFLESLARDRKIIVSNTPDGDFLFIGEHSFPAVGDLIEGINIKKAQVTITDEYARSMFNTLGQKIANDQSHMKEASEQEAKRKGVLERYSIKTTAMEHPVATPEEIVLRNDTEKMWDEDLTRIDATIIVYGWFRQRPSIIKSFALDPELGGGGGTSSGHILWQAGDEAMVHSPMALLHHQVLKIRTVTWTQDRQNGTQTTLQLVNTRGLNGGAAIPRPRSQPNTSAPQTADLFRMPE